MLEMTIIKLCSPELCVDLESLEKRIRTLEINGVKVSSAPAATPAEAPAAEKPQPKKAVIEDEELPPPIEEEEPPAGLPEEPVSEVPAEEIVESVPTTKGEEGELAAWSEILKVLAKSCPPISGVLNGSRAFISGQYLLIDAPNPMFRNFINSKNAIYRDAIRKAATQVLGQTYKLGPYKPVKTDEEADPLKALAEKLKQFDIPKGE
jgi:DNA polymerase-3 subunit gamma/tau